MAAFQDCTMEHIACITASCEHGDVGMDVMSVEVVSKVDILQGLWLLFIGKTCLSIFEYK
jgi:hypothetical protein